MSALRTPATAAAARSPIKIKNRAGVLIERKARELPAFKCFNLNQRPVDGTGCIHRGLG